MTENKTSAQWWAEVKADPEKFNHWLQRQHIGETTAADRIVRLGQQFEVSRADQHILDTIASQERQHAQWIQELLIERGVDPIIGEAESRYWAQTLPGIEDFKTGAAVAAHAEAMRLERIEVICNDPDAPEDVRNVFRAILKDERWHERAFSKLAGAEAIAATLGAHEKGLEALGLVI